MVKSKFEPDPMESVAPSGLTGTGSAEPRTQAARRTETRAALMAAARAMFAERGFAGAAREDIVAKAGVTRGAMYHHFESKQALFQAVFEAVERELCDAIALAAMADPDPVEQLRLGARAFLENASTLEVRRIVLLDGPSVLDPQVRRTLSERYGLGLVRESLRAIESAGRLTLGPVDALAAITMAAMHEAATAVAEGANANDHESIVLALIDRITKD